MSYVFGRSGGLQVKDGFVSHIKQQVEDAEIRLEAVFLRIDLVIRSGDEFVILDRMFRSDGFAEIAGLFLGVFVGRLHTGINIKELAHLLGYLPIEIIEIIPTTFKERTYVVLIEFEERAFAVSTLKGMPVQMTPIAVVADANVLHVALCTIEPFDGNRQYLRAVGGSDDTTITISLLDEMVVPFDKADIVAIEFLIPLYRTEISGGQ